MAVRLGDNKFNYGERPISSQDINDTFAVIGLYDYSRKSYVVKSGAHYSFDIVLNGNVIDSFSGAYSAVIGLASVKVDTSVDNTIELVSDGSTVTSITISAGTLKNGNLLIQALASVNSSSTSATAFQLIILGI